MNKKFFVLILCIMLAVSIYLMLQKRKPESALPPLIIGTSVSVSTALLEIAKNQGFFADQGIDVHIRHYKSAALGLDDMLAGNIPIAGVSETPIVYKSFESDDFKIFATACTANNDPKIIARTDHNVNTPDDLVGKKIGTTKQGQSAHFFLYLFLLKHGIRAEDVTIVHDSPANIEKQLTAGSVDAASLFEPYATFAAQRLSDKAIVFDEPGIYLKTFNLVAKTAFLQNHQETIKHFLYALIRAEKYVTEHTEETIDIISTSYGTDKEIVRKYLAFSSLDITLSNALLITLKDEARWTIKYEHIHQKQIPDYLKFIHTDALEAVKPESVTLLK